MGDVRTVEQVEEFRCHVESSRLAKREVLQDAEVHRGQRMGVQRISAEAERSGREGKGVTLIRVKARQSVAADAGGKPHSPRAD